MWSLSVAHAYNNHGRRAPCFCSTVDGVLPAALTSLLSRFVTDSLSAMLPAMGTVSPALKSNRVTVGVWLADNYTQVHERLMQSAAAALSAAAFSSVRQRPDSRHW